MKILITGATGFIGRSLCRHLFLDGHELLVLSRKKNLPADWELPAEILTWNPIQDECPRELDDIDAVVNLMGESIADKPWTMAQKERLIASRELATRNLAKALQRRKTPLVSFISASAIGYYPYDEDAEQLEDSPSGQHFLAQVCQTWENALACINAKRTVVLRLGLVLGENGGALARMRPIFAGGLGGRLGSGKQIMSWIHRDDLIRIISQALQVESWQGTYNCVAPGWVSNKRFTLCLAKTLGVPALLPVPSIVLRLLLGERSEILLKGQKVRPQRLLQQGFVFRYPQLPEAMLELCSVQASPSGEKACERLESVQFIERPLSEVFQFFCTTHNLERITPSTINFKILSMSTPEIQKGSVIQYRLKLYGVPLTWRTLIEEWQPNKLFVDVQTHGPYSVWHHTHSFESCRGGTLMRDEVKYRIPGGLMGRLLALAWVRKNVQNIFSFRRQVIAKIFS